MNYRLRPKPLHSTLAVLSTWLLCAAQVMADTRHSLAFEWQRYRETLTVANQETDINPELLNLHYTYQPNPSWAWTASAWSGQDQAMLNNRWQLMKELDGLSSSISYQRDLWALMMGLSYSQSDLNGTNKTFDASITDEGEAWELFGNFNYDLDLGDWWLTPTVGMGYQTSAIATKYHNFSLLNSGRRTEDYRGAYLFSSLCIAYPVTTDTALWLPSVSVGWNQPVWGDLVNITSRYDRSQTMSRNEQQSNDELEGSGYISVGLLLSVSDYFANIGYNQPFDDDVIGAQLSLELGINF